MDGFIFAFIIASISALATVFFRDSIKAIFKHFWNKRQSKTEWIDESISYLQKVDQKGSNMQASSDVRIEKLDEIEQISEDFLAHVRTPPNNLDPDLKNELIQVGYLLGYAANFIRDIHSATSLNEIMDAEKEFKNRTRVENIAIDEMIEKLPESDISKWNQEIEWIFNEIDISFEEQFNLSMVVLEDVEREDEKISDLPWGKIDSALNEDTLDTLVTETENSFINVLLVKIPKETMESLELEKQ